MNTLYPIFLKLTGRAVLVIGGGAVARRRVPRLLEAGARLRLVSPAAAPELAELARHGRLEWLERPYRHGDLDGFDLALVAAGDTGVAAEVRREAAERGIWLSIAGDEAAGDFHLPAVATRGDVRVAVSTAGISPAGAAQLRDSIASWLDAHPRLVSLALARGRPGAEGSAAPAAPCGKVFLVGAGPGDPGLLTLRALELLETADVVFHDRLVSDAVLALIPPRVERVYVGKEAGCSVRAPIETLLVESARAGKRAVRLKGGDPLVFGRGGEEMAALAREGIDFEVVPGVTALTAVPASAGIPLTMRGVAREVIVRSGHPAAPGVGAPGPARPQTTHVYFMAGTRLDQVASELAADGLPPHTPVAVIQRGTLPGQRTLFTSLAELPRAAETAPIDTPALVVAGEVVRAAGADGLAGLVDELARHDVERSAAAGGGT